VWIHDYHLMLAANSIRSASLSCFRERFCGIRFSNHVNHNLRSDNCIILRSFFDRDACDDEGIEIRMGFFLHIPFPSFDIIRIFPWVDEILMGMLGGGFL